MTLMTNDLNDHFFGGRGKGENARRKGKRKTARRSCFEIRKNDWRGRRNERGTCDGIAGNGDPAGPAGEERERLELENLGTSAGYGYLPVAQARYRELQRARQGIYNLEPGFARLGILHHTGTHIFLQRFR